MQVQWADMSLYDSNGLCAANRMPTALCTKSSKSPSARKRTARARTKIMNGARAGLCESFTLVQMS